MMDLYATCRNHRAKGVPLHIRNYATPVGSRFWVYYGYAPPIASGLTEQETRLVLRTASRVHNKVKR